MHGKPEQHVLEQLGIRTMSKAVYTTDNIGHYGLGFEHYCHFTSPIRRYPDVLVHRILQQCIENNIQPIKHLEVKCRHCSDQGAQGYGNRACRQQIQTGGVHAKLYWR